MLIDVMANNVMLSRNIERSKFLINNLKALNITDYRFELSPHAFGGPPPLYVQHQLEETNEKATLQTIGHVLQFQQHQRLQHHKNTFNTTNTTITGTKNDDNS